MVNIGKLVHVQLVGWLAHKLNNNFDPASKTMGNCCKNVCSRGYLFQCYGEPSKSFFRRKSLFIEPVVVAVYWQSSEAKVFVYFLHSNVFCAPCYHPYASTSWCCLLSRRFSLLLRLLGSECPTFLPNIALAAALAQLLLIWSTSPVLVCTPVWY